MKLPKEILEEGIEDQLVAVLEKDVVSIAAAAEVSIPLLQLTPELRKNLFYAQSLGELIYGFERIQKTLINEQKGLHNVKNMSNRVSRLLFLTNDGSARFYREIEFLHEKQGGRVLICRLDISSAVMADVLGLKDKMVKAVLINRKASVLNVLRSLIA